MEQLLNPSWGGRPIAVGGGVVLAASYEAKACELCPERVFVGGHFKEYQRPSDAVIKILDDFTPLVERISIDEAFTAIVEGHKQSRIEELLPWNYPAE